MKHFVYNLCLINFKKTLFILISILILLLIIFLYNQHLAEPLKQLNLQSEGLDIKKYVGLQKKEFRNLDGENITVAIIDSGLNINSSFSKTRILAFIDLVNNRLNPYDDNGHGTFIAGIVGANGNLRGIAPMSNLVIIKALDENGECNQNTFIKSLVWLRDNINKYNIKVVNLSIGIPETSDEYNIKINKLLNDISRMNVTIIVSAGNFGPNKGTILYPGMNKDVITVGSVNGNKTYTKSDDHLTNFTSRGSDEKKPDISTLGIDITSIDLNNHIILDSGTSYSAGIISGICALVLQAYPHNSLKETKNFLINNTIKLGNDFKELSFMR